MPPEVQQFFRDVGEFTGDSTTARGIVTVGVAVLAVGTWLFRWLRGGKPDRVRVNVDAPTGEAVCVRIGDEDATKKV